jgi:iron complex outermembrane receptor protein
MALAATHAASLLAVPSVLEAAPATGQMEEIVVTARQREERIQDVPATITAFTAADIRNAGIERPQDFIALTPGVAQVQTAEVGDMQVTIRGINTGRDAETNVALVVDGVLQTNVNALNQELFGVTQIEILKGPQGALYGRNALAGAIIVTTRKPGDELEVEVGAGVGSDGLYKGNLYVGGPLSDNVRAGLSAYYRNQDGQWNNVYLNCDDCVDYLEDMGFTGRLMMDVGDSGTLDFKARYSTVEAGAINFNAAFALPAFAAAPVIGHPGFFEDSNDHDFTYINNVKPENEQDNLNLSVKGDWDVGLGTVTGVLAWNQQDNNFITDGASPFGQYRAEPTCIATNDAIFFGDPDLDPFDGTGVIPRPGLVFPTDPNAGGEVGSVLPPYDPTTCGGYQYQERNQDDLSFELRLTSPGDQRLRWIAGVYFADIERDVTVSFGADKNQGFIKDGFVPTSGPNPTNLLYDDTFSSMVYAVFGQLAYDVVDNVEVALALRYDYEDREVKNHVPRVAAQTPEFCDVPGAFGTVPQVCPDTRTIYINPAYNRDPNLTSIPDRDESFDQLQPKLTVNWGLNEQVSLFASYGVGFRSGGFNSSGSEATIEYYFGSLEADDGSPAITNVFDDYDKEVSKAFEAGFKATLLDNSLSLGGAVFHTDLDDMQFFNFFAGPFGLLRVVTNIDSVQINGFELDARWQATDWLALSGGYGYVSGEIDQYAGRPYTEGNEIPYSPEYTANLAADVRFPISNSITLVGRLDGSFVGETWFHPVQDNQVGTLFGVPGDYSKTKRDPYNVFNARLGVQTDSWGVTAWTRNFTDEDYLAENITAPEFGGSFIHNSPGRSYGVDVIYRF